MEKKYIVYCHTLPNGKVYIGITSKKPQERWQSGKGYIYNKRFYNAILKYGWNNIQHDILLKDLTKEEAAQKEIELIQFYQSNDSKYGYNILKGGFDTSQNAMNQKLPSLQEIKTIKKYHDLFFTLLKLCNEGKVIETTTTLYYENEKLIKKEVKDNVKTILPNLKVVNLLIDNYEQEKELEEIINNLKKLKDKYDD